MSWPSSWGPAPRFRTLRNPLRPTYGPAVARLAELLGKPLLPWQRYVADVALEVQSEAAGDPFPGRWAYNDVVITVQRRGGKTVLLQPVVAHRAGANERARIFQTAQTRKDGVKRWRDLSDALMTAGVRDSSGRLRPYLANQLKRVTGAGAEMLTWLTTGSTLEPFAPNEKAVHGDEPDLVLVDEFWSMDAAQGAAIDQAVRPTWLTNDGQMWRFSTAGTDASGWYNAARAKGRQAVKDGRQLGVFYIEFSVPDEVGGVKVEDLDDETLLDVVMEYHPRSDLPGMREFLTTELADDEMTRADFLRAYGNHVQTGIARPKLVAPADMARALTRDEIPVEARTGLAVDVDPEKRQSAISAAWRDEDGRALTTVIKCDPGSRWAADETIGIAERNDIPVVAVNDAGPARDIADQLATYLAKFDDDEQPFVLLRVNLRDYQAACNRWLDGVVPPQEAGGRRPEPTLRHDGSPHLIEAVSGPAYREKSGQSWVFRTRDQPIPALTSNALALWAFDHMPEVEDLGEFQIG